MADERPILNLTSSTAPTEEMKKAFKAQLAGVVTRGFVVDRLNVPLPPDVYGEWIHDDPVALTEAKILGFEIDKEFAAKHNLHSDGAGNAKIGDTIFMTIPKWKKDIIEQAKLEQYHRFHGKDGKTKPAEENQYAANIAKETPIINESKSTNAELTSLVSD